ncbi:MAG: DUF2958 domain-containing protein [Caulobacteraceae bacterium]|nr:MAG: DUF2958 domain-containing protein [Caulobacteraceae bacterium]
MPKLITTAQMRRLQRQWAELDQARRTGRDYDPQPILKLFTPDAGATWLIAALSPDERTAWGVCDLGLGFVEIGELDMAELRAVRGRLGLPIERDRWFTPSATLNGYQAKGAAAGRLSA